MKNTNNSIPMDKLLQEAIAQYHGCIPGAKLNLSKISRLKKILHERKLRKYLKKTLAEIPIPDEAALRNLSSSEKAQLKEKLYDAAVMLDQEKLLYTTPFLMEFLKVGFLESTEAFFNKAQEMEPDMVPEDLFQAVRNVWIMNCLQLLYQQPVFLTPSLFSYSMLYPYTDNFLDDPSVTTKEKSAFNEMILRKITGQPVSSLSAYESKVFSLLTCIEEEFPREIFPMVYEGLWYIQDAQTKSLLQGHSELQSQDKLLQLSFYKGGASVLADACLVKGSLTENEYRFAFGYGTFLQLLDDLQDRLEDATNRHQTIYSTASHRQSLDEQVERLLLYIDTVLASFEPETEPSVPMKEIIRSCMRMMVESVIAKNPSYVTRSYYKTLESYSSVRLSFYPVMERMMKDALKRSEKKTATS